MTLKEKEIHTFLTYIFVFRSFDSNKNYVTSIPKTDDLSSYKERYNQFLITETPTTPDTIDGELTLGVEGIYYYSVYSINSVLTEQQVAAIELMTQEQIDAYVNYCLETGVCYVEKTLTETPTYTPNVINVTTYQPT